MLRRRRFSFRFLVSPGRVVYGGLVYNVRYVILRSIRYTLFFKGQRMHVHRMLDIATPVYPRPPSPSQSLSRSLSQITPRLPTYALYARPAGLLLTGVSRDDSSSCFDTQQLQEDQHNTIRSGCVLTVRHLIEKGRHATLHAQQQQAQGMYAAMHRPACCCSCTAVPMRRPADAGPSARGDGSSNESRMAYPRGYRRGTSTYSSKVCEG